ncbi:MAG: hypothetical protein KAT05_09345 [Spirochaetes bacterium]|nr:hypothetical protein [Spirochaetota bacterium]
MKKITNIFLLFLVLMSGCIAEKEVEPEQVQFNELIWKGPNAFNLIVENKGEPLFVNIGLEREGVYNSLKVKSSELDLLFELKKGENILSINDFEYVTWLGYKKQAILSLRTLNDGKKPSIEVLRKVIDLPYVNLEIKPSNTVIHKAGDFITITNKGNIEGTFSLRDIFGNKSSCGITSSDEIQLGIGDSGNINLKVIPCEKFAQIETGDTRIWVYYQHFTESQTSLRRLDDITLNYKYE